MKKKQRCLFKRFAALVAAFMMAFSLSVPALAASDTEADMPSSFDFERHLGSWFVWRKAVLGVSGYELLCSPVTFDSSGNYSGPGQNYSSPLFDISVISEDDERYSYACAYSVPLYGLSGSWSDLPSFPVGSSSRAATPIAYATPGSSAVTSTVGFLTSFRSVSDRSVISSNSIGSSTDSFSLNPFYSPLYAYPFAFRSYSGSNRGSYSIQGGDSSFIRTSSSQYSYLNIFSSRVLTGTSTFSPLPYGFTVPSSDIGFVLVSTQKVGTGVTLTSASDFSLSSPPYINFSLFVPASFLPDVKVGDWISDSPEDLQDAITNEFGVDSGKLKDSKDSLNSWNSTSSVDTDLANTSLSTINALFQNLGQFLAIVSLMIFGAVVLRMLVRKAVDG